MQNRQNKFTNKRRYVVPTNFPATLNFKRDTIELDIIVADQAAYDAFRMNVRNLDGGALSAKKRELGNNPFSATDLTACLKTGFEPFTGFENDGSMVTCGICLRGFQPVLIPFTGNDGQKGTGGNFLVLNAEKVKAMQAALLNELGDEEGGRVFSSVSKIAADATAMIMGGEAVPSRAVALPVCKSCRETRQKAGFRDFYHSQKTARTLLPTVDQKIQVRQTVNAVSAALGGFQRRELRHAISAGPAHSRSGNGRDQRERKPRVNWYGASLEKETADKLTAAGYTLPTALAAAESGKLIEEGVAHPGSIGPITFALQKAKDEGQLVIGSATTLASKVAAPGATPVVPAKGKGKRLKTVDVTGKGGAVKLSDLRS